MGFGRFLTYRIIITIVILVLTVVITLAIMGPALDNILQKSVVQEVRNSILQRPDILSRFRDPKDLEAYINGQIYQAIHNLALDEPWYSPNRLGNMVLKLLTLDLGQSFFLRSYGGSNNVRDIILEALPRTILLFTTATIISLVIGLLLGVVTARRAGSPQDQATSTFAITSGSFPLWWVGMIMIFVFAYGLRVFPARATPLIAPSDPTYPLALLYHMTLPLITLVMLSFGGWAYVVRNLVIGILQEDYITVATAKGVPERKVLYGHALKSAAPPVITIIALSLSGSLGGAIITEAVFDWPGIGRLYFAAISVLDIPVIVGLTYVTTLVFLVSILIADVAYGFFDPRVKVG